MDLTRLNSKDFFNKHRYQGIVQMIFDCMTFDEKITLMNFNKSIYKCIISKTRYIKVI